MIDYVWDDNSKTINNVLKSNNLFKMLKKILFKIKYPKLALLTLSIFIGYLIYTDENNFYFHSLLEKTGYWGIFVSGVFLVYGFTAGPAAAALLIASPMKNFWLTALVALGGSLIGNFIVFKTLKISIETELEDLAKNNFYLWIKKKISHHTPAFVYKYILPALAGFISATPLPDEIVAALVSKSKNISLAVFTFFSFFFSVFGIFIILLLGRCF
jgi:hypothetical protein